MGQLKIAGKEINAAYSTVLRYGIFCNAIALFLCVVPANAYVFPTDGTTVTGEINQMNVVVSGRNVIFDEISASGIEEQDYFGAVIENLGTSNIIGPGIFTNNYAPGGGVIYNAGNIVIDNATFGGIDNTDLENPVSLGNNAVNGGAIYNDQSGNMTVGGTFVNNAASDWGGGIYNAGNLTVSDNSVFNYNTAGSVGGAITNALGTSVLKLGKNVSFTGNESVKDGGAIGNYKGATLVDGTTFVGNRAQTGISDVDAIGGGAMSLGAESTTDIANAMFVSNESGFNGGAIGTRNALSADNTAAKLGIKDSVFTDNIAEGTVTSIFNQGKSTELILSGGNGGALDNHFYNSNEKVGYVYVSGATFNANQAVNGGAIYNNGTADKAGNSGKLYIENTIFTGNMASDQGGAIYNDGIMNVVNAVFKNNLTTTGGILLKSEGGAIYNSGDLTIDNALFDNNSALFGSGAVRNTGILKINNSLFKNNSASINEANGGAIANDTNGATIILTDTSFEDNHVNAEGGVGGAISNTTGIVTINAKNKDVLFSDNTADNVANDIDNTKGTLNLNASEGRKITLNGGISSHLSRRIDTIVNINQAGNQTGTIEINGTLNKQNVNVAGGVLHLGNGASVNGSVVNVANGATMNTQNRAINNYASQVTLADGSNVMVDANATNIDKFNIVDNGTVTLTGLKMLSDFTTDDSITTNLATAGNISIGDGIKVYTTAYKYDLAGNNSNNGELTIERSAPGGLKAAASDTGNVTYTLTGDVADETVDTDTIIANNNLLLAGAGTENTDNYVSLGAKLVVADDASLTIEDAKIAGIGKLRNALGGYMAILNSDISVGVENFGNFVSDPTVYNALFENNGTASFVADTFNAGLTNEGTVNLSNGVMFGAGSDITGDGLINLVSGTTHFNNTLSSNTVKLASGANFDGDVGGAGALDTRNSTIDTVTGFVSGGDLYVDAKLGNTNTIDTFGGISGANIKEINILGSEYGNGESATLALGAGATLDSNVQIKGTNYYTDMSYNAATGDLILTDKLLNTSGLYDKLGADWSGGTYIKNAANYTNNEDSTHLTVGQALIALDAQVAENTSNILTKQNALVSGSGVDITNDTISVSGITNANIAADAAIAKVQLAGDVQTSLAHADTAYTAVSNATSNVLSNNTDLITSGGVYANAANAAYDSETNYTNGTIGNAIKDLQGHLSNYATASTVDALLADKQDLITDTATIAADGTGFSVVDSSINTVKLADDAVTLDKIADAAMIQGTDDFATSTTLTTKGYVDQQLIAKQNVIDSDNKLAVNLVDGLAVVATSGRASDLDNDAGFITTSGLVTEVTAASTDNQVASAKAVYDAINDSLTGGGVIETAVNNAMANATTMQHTSDQMAAGAIYNNFGENASVTEAVAQLDTNMGKIHGLVTADASGKKTFNGTKSDASKNTDTSGNYVGNLAVGTTTEDHLIALDNAIGALSTLDTADGVLDNNASVATNLQNLDTALNNVRTDVTVQDKLVLNQSIAYTDERVNELDKELSSGIASAVALSSVAVSNVQRGEVSVGAGYGYYNGCSAAAFGAAMGLTNRWSVNAGAGVTYADVSFRAGTNYKFKLF